MDTVEMLAQLNDYAESADNWDDEEGQNPYDNIWNDVIYGLPGYDEAATEILDSGGGSDTFALEDGTMFYWDQQRGSRWFEGGDAVIGDLLSISDQLREAATSTTELLELRRKVAREYVDRGGSVAEIAAICRISRQMAHRIVRV